MEITVITTGKQVLPSGVVVVFHFMVLMRKGTATVGAGGGLSVQSDVGVGHGVKRNLSGEYFVDGFAVRHDVFVETINHVGSRVRGGRGLILREICNAMTAEPTQFVLVDNTGFFLFFTSGSVSS